MKNYISQSFRFKYMNNQFLPFSSMYIEFISVVCFFKPHKNYKINLNLQKRLKTDYPHDLKQ